MRIRGAVLAEMGLPAPYAESRPLEVAELELDPPGPGELLIEVRAAVNKELENLRNSKAIGGNLQAEVTLYGDEALQQSLAKLDDELRFALITSAATVAPLADAPADAVATEVPGLKLKIVKSAHAKCGRCWHFRADVGSNAAHPELCERCVSNIEGSGEVRKHV